jgi:L-rhamnose-H+ transport protein
MQSNPFLGAGLHSVGALSASSCYTPQKKTKRWAWEVYWISQATFAWLVLPIIGAFLTVPNYLEVLAGVPADVMLRTFLLGALYGVGGLTFGLGIRYIGFSLNYAIAIGISACLGTLLPLIWDPNRGFVWEIVDKFSTGPGLVVLAGIVVSLAGIVICGWAGALRGNHGSGSKAKYNLKLGLPLAAMAGTLSAVFNYSLLAGAPIEIAAVDAGANEILKMNAIYPFSNGGAWVTNALWCVILLKRNGTASQLLRLPGDGGSSLRFYYLMALASGVLWYGQFFFYGMGHSYLGQDFGFTSWGLHMAILVLFSNLFGFLFREWEGASKRPIRILQLGMACIVVATLIITYGNYLGGS